MYRTVIRDQVTEYRRITKRAARKLWGKEAIALCPVNLRPGFPWASHMVVSVRAVQEGVTFENIVNDFEFYNCTGKETGTYTAFYRMRST
jgi:hypothetical protein